MAVGTTGTLVAERYRVKRALGRGGMAVVYLAEDERLDREVAVKRLHADSAEDVEIRFVREAKLGASLNHPNLVWVFDILTDEEGLLIVMEYVDGPHLGRELSSGPMQPRRAVEVLAATASALEHAHEHGVVHRDVKPANVLLGRDGDHQARRPRHRHRRRHHAHHPQRRRAGHGLLHGPRAAGGRAGERRPPTSTRWPPWPSRCSAARKARSGRTPMEVAHAISTEAPPDLRETWPARPARGRRRAAPRRWRANPEDRPDSVCDFVSDLARALGEETTARHAARGGAGGHRWGDGGGGSR